MKYCGSSRSQTLRVSRIDRIDIFVCGICLSKKENSVPGFLEFLGATSTFDDFKRLSISEVELMALASSNTILDNGGNYEE